MAAGNHQIRDRLYLWYLRSSSKPVFREGLDTPSLEDHIKAVAADLPDLTRPGRFSVRAATLSGPLEVNVLVHAWAGADAPLVIFHHDGGERPVTRTLHQIFPRRKQDGVNVIAIEAPFHRSAKDYQAALARLETYLTMLALPIVLTERVLSAAPMQACAVRAVTGLGQGGTIANWHHLLFNTADIYVPFLAGAAPAEAFLGPIKSSLEVRRNPERLRAALNFDDRWAQHEHPNVFPVLSSTDQFTPFERQARSYGSTPIEVWGLSRLAAVRSAPRMRDKIMRHVHLAQRRPAGGQALRAIAGRAV